MLIKLTSSTSGEVVMFAKHARLLFEIIGKECTASGVFTFEQLPAALARLYQAVDEEKLAAKLLANEERHGKSPPRDARQNRLTAAGMPRPSPPDAKDGENRRGGRGRRDRDREQPGRPRMTAEVRLPAVPGARRSGVTGNRTGTGVVARIGGPDGFAILSAFPVDGNWRRAEWEGRFAGRRAGR